MTRDTPCLLAVLAMAFSLSAHGGEAGPVQAVKDGAVQVGTAIKDTAVQVGHGAKTAAGEIGRGAVEVGHAARDAASHAGKAVKRTATRVGEMMKPGDDPPNRAPVSDATPTMAGAGQPLR